MAEDVHSADVCRSLDIEILDLGAKWCDSPADMPKGQDYQGKNKITSLVAKGPLTPSMGKIKVGWGKIR